MGIEISKVSSVSPYYYNGKISYEFTKIQLDILKEVFIKISDALDEPK